MTGDWEALTGGEIAVGAPVEFTAVVETIAGVVDALWIPALPLKNELGAVVVMCRVKTAHPLYPFWVGPHTQFRRL